MPIDDATDRAFADAHAKIMAARDAHQQVIEVLERYQTVFNALGGETGWWTEAGALDGKLDLQLLLKGPDGDPLMQLSGMLREMIRENLPLFLATLLKRNREQAERLVLPPAPPPTLLEGGADAA